MNFHYYSLQLTTNEKKKMITEEHVVIVFNEFSLL